MCFGNTDRVVVEESTVNDDTNNSTGDNNSNKKECNHHAAVDIGNWLMGFYDEPIVGGLTQATTSAALITRNGRKARQ